MQLNSYRFILESEYGMRVNSMWLGLAHPRLSAPRLVEVPRMEREMAALLDHATHAVERSVYVALMVFFS